MHVTVTPGIVMELCILLEETPATWREKGPLPAELPISTLEMEGERDLAQVCPSLLLLPNAVVSPGLTGGYSCLAQGE